MKQLRMARKMVIGAMAASMVLASAPAWAESVSTDGTIGSTTGTQTGTTGSTATSTSSIRTKFPDVSTTHWAIQHITKLAIEGVVEGNEAGQYKPEDAVSQQDVLIMAIRMMGDEEAVKSSNTTYNLPFVVSGYAQAYVGEAISKGLITIKEETDGSASNKTAWGSRPATREWVAKIMVRMLGKQADAENLAANTTAFTDNSKISTWAAGYVNEAVSLGLVQGFEDGSFQPQGSITRAQMATFLSRSEKQSVSKSPRYAKGYVNSLADGKLVLQDANGSLTTYNVTADTSFYGKKEGERIASNTIQQTYEVSVLQAGGTAYYVEVTNDQLQIDAYSGSLFSVDIANLKLYLINGDNPQEYDISSDVAVTDANGRGYSLGELVKNSIIEVRKNKLVKSSKFTQIVIKQVPVSKTSDGTIQAIDRDKKEFKILDKTSGQIESYTIGSLVNVLLPGNIPSEIGALHVGDTVSYTVKDNQVTAISVTKQIDIGSTAQGTVIGTVGGASGVINIRTADGRPAAYDLSDTVLVNIDGKTSAGLSDLTSGDEVELELLNNKVQAIHVTNSSLQNLVYVKIVTYDSTSKYLTVEDNSGKPYVFKMTDQTAIQMLGASYTLSNFASNFTTGKKVDLQVKDITVSSVQFSTQLSGVITELNPATKQITIKSGSQNISFNMTYPPQIELFGQTNPTLDDLKIGDTVTLDVNPGQQDAIIKITASKTQLYKVLLTNVNARQLTVQDTTSGSNAVFALDSSTTLVIAGKVFPTFADIPTDEYLKLSFKGSVVTKAEVVTPVRGKVLAVDAAAGTLTVQDFAGQTQMITIGVNSSVVSSGKAAPTLAGVKINDRVQVMKDAADKTIVQVATSGQKTFGSYNATLNQLAFTTAAGSETYTLYSRAYLHQGTQTLGISSFAASDAVTVYAIDNRVIELEKQ